MQDAAQQSAQYSCTALLSQRCNTPKSPPPPQTVKSGILNAVQGAGADTVLVYGSASATQ